MSEHLQTRTEHSRSLEDAERFKALETLKELGFLISLSDVDSYHGRLAYDGEPVWEVDPAFKNGGNDSGNHNINGRTTLYTGSEENAHAFAQARGSGVIHNRVDSHFKGVAEAYTSEQIEEWAVRETKKRREWYENLPDDTKGYYRDEPRVYTSADFSPVREGRRLKSDSNRNDFDELWRSLSSDIRKQIHEIVALDIDASVINSEFRASTLDDESEARYHDALKALSLPITEGGPVDFEDRNTLQPILASANRHKFGWTTFDNADTIAQEAGVSQKAAQSFASAANSRILSITSPAYLVNQLLDSDKAIVSATLGEGDEAIQIPISIQYAENWLRANHIVGIKQKPNSATLGKEITSISLFDLNKVMTKEGMDKKLLKIQKTMGSIASGLEGRIDGDKPLLRLLEDAHAKPKALVDAAMQVEGFKEIFDMDAGNWEGFTLAEHTETVLDNFEQNYADELPVSMLAPMRLIILAHDIGKPIASRDGDRHNQSLYNVKYAAEFFQKLGIDSDMGALMITVLGDGAKLAFDLDIRKGGDAVMAQMDNLAEQALTDFYDQAPTEEQKQGFIEMCRMLQICDGGAYTSMAVTRNRQGIGRYRNHPSFNDSFEQPVSLGKRDIRTKK